MTKRLTWQVVSAASGALAALAVRQVGMTLWRRQRHVDPPRHPADHTVSWADALIWATSAAVGTAVARVVAQRGAAAAWTAATGTPPPDLDPR
jgi:hypothetical protein